MKNNLHEPGPAQRALKKLRQNVARQFALLTKATSAKLRRYVALTQYIVVRHYVILTEAPSNKLQAPSYKPQAPSHKQQAPGSVNHGTWILEKFLMP